LAHLFILSVKFPFLYKKICQNEKTMTIFVISFVIQLFLFRCIIPCFDQALQE